ncbi:MAG TPA: M20/M25/M40 family metallo-hydrolase [Actinomycetota bacterium]|nr:M20/M25/M40 family metallo-hydrolase [Actinomycetota bacterium]
MPEITGDVTGEVTELLQLLIRNACVNDGTRDSGGELRNADLLASYLEGTEIDMQLFEPVPGRASLVARIEGSDPAAPSLVLMGHTDVVPVNADRWREDPFGGELIDGEVWGRGAVDMLNLTSSMAVAIRRLLSEGFRPKGTLIYLAVADEEALGTHGAKWLTEQHPDVVQADYVVTEFGGVRLPLPSTTGPKVPVMVAEKGSYWCTLRVTGTPSHASMPLRTDNAVVKAAEVVRRLAEYRPQTRLEEVWRRFVDAADFPDEMRAALSDPEQVGRFVESAPDIGLARMMHAATHTTFAPTVVRGGTKTNIIPDAVELQVDVRTLPGVAGADARAMLQEALGDLADSVEIVAQSDDQSSASPQDTPLWDSLTRVTSRLMPDVGVVPFLLVGATDARFFRRIGSTAYGYGLLSDRIAFPEFMTMFHGDNERVDVESLRLCAELWMGLIQDLLG